MQSFFEFTDQYPWALPTIFAVILLFGLFIRRRALAARATRGPERTSDDPGPEPGPHHSL